MSSGLLAFGMTGFASKTLVFVAAALLPLQPLSVMSCGCGSHDQRAVDANLRQEQTDGESACGRRADCCCCSSHLQPRPCCAKRHRGPAKCCCGTGNQCSCESDHPSPPVPQVPPEGRSQSLSDLAEPLLAALVDPADLQVFTGLASRDWPSAASGIERCIMLSRFHL